MSHRFSYEPDHVDALRRIARIAGTIFSIWTFLLLFAATGAFPDSNAPFLSLLILQPVPTLGLAATILGALLGWKSDGMAAGWILSGALAYGLSVGLTTLFAVSALIGSCYLYCWIRSHDFKTMDMRLALSDALDGILKIIAYPAGFVAILLILRLLLRVEINPPRNDINELAPYKKATLLSIKERDDPLVLRIIQGFEDELQKKAKIINASKRATITYALDKDVSWKQIVSFYDEVLPGNAFHALAYDKLAVFAPNVSRYKIYERKALILHSAIPDTWASEYQVIYLNFFVLNDKNYNLLIIGSLLAPFGQSQ